MNRKSIRIGQLEARMEAVASRYGVTVNTIARKAVLSLERGSLFVDEMQNANVSTPRDSAVVKVETNESADKVRSAINAYLARYEGDNAPPPPQALPEAVERDIRALEQQTIKASLKALNMEV